VPDQDDEPYGEWWVVRMVVDITVGDDHPASHEDRFVLVAATTAEEARTRGEHEAQQYTHSYLNADGETLTWIVRGISDIYAVRNNLENGTELYSAFVDSEWADILMESKEGPVQSWERENPGKDSGEATVAEVMEAWDRAHDKSRRQAFPGNDAGAG
jgi:hypothetical protein